MWCRVVLYFTMGSKGTALLGTAEVRDALVAVHALASQAAADACYWWCGAVNNLAVNDVSRRLFGTTAVGVCNKQP
jgi:hypothetical protein